RQDLEVTFFDFCTEFPSTCPVNGAIDRDPVQPGAERPAAVETIEVPHGREEGLLCDVLGGGGIVHDEVRRPVGARPVLAKEGLEIRDRSMLGTSDSGTLGHPTTLRRNVLTSSIRDRHRPSATGRRGG